MVMFVEPSGEDVFSYRRAALVESSGSSEAVAIGPYDGMMLSVNSTSIAGQTLKFRPVGNTQDTTGYVSMTITQDFNALRIAWNGMSSGTSSLLDIWGLNF